MTEKELFIELKSRLNYNGKTGIFVRKINTKGHNLKGKKTGCEMRGYLYIKIKQKQYLAHRLAWLYTYGYLPKKQIDHINHIKDDNRIINLREVSQKENNRNQKIRIDNTSGLAGVHFSKKLNKWYSKITIDGKEKYLGVSDNKTLAFLKRKNANKKYNFHKNHGT